MKEAIRDFPSGAVDKNPPASAGGTGSISGQGRFHMLQGRQACAPQLLSPCSRAHELKLLSPRAQSLCSAIGEATTMRSPFTTSDQPLLTTTRGSLCKTMKTQLKKKKKFHNLPAFFRPHYALSQLLGDKNCHTVSGLQLLEYLCI